MRQVRSAFISFHAPGHRDMASVGIQPYEVAAVRRMLIGQGARRYSWRPQGGAAWVHWSTETMTLAYAVVDL